MKREAGSRVMSYKPWREGRDGGSHEELERRGKVLP